MDPLQLLSDLEGLRDKIPAGWLRDDFEGLIASIRNIYEASVKVITPSKPVSDAKQNLAAHHATLSDLCTQLENSLSSFQDVYTGAGSDSYHTTASASLLSLQDVRDHFATASLVHDTMATSFDTANEAQIALVALLAGLAVTLGILIFSLGTTAPVTVPAAVAEAAGGAVSIGLLTDAEAAAAAAALSLVWASLPTALLAGLATTLATDLLGNLVLHPPTITGWSPPTTTTTTTSPAITKLYSTIKTTPDGRRIRVRKLSPGEVRKLKTPWGESFHDVKGENYEATDDIYVDQDGNYWIGRPGSDNVELFP